MSQPCQPASFAGGVAFYLIGAWPVGFFFGLDALLIYVAFRVNYRAADAYEEVTVTPSELRVRKVTHRGKVSEWSLNPVWVRLERETHELAERRDEHDRRTEPRRRRRLIAALAAVEPAERAARHGLARGRQPLRLDDQVDVDRADDEDPSAHGRGGPTSP